MKTTLLQLNTSIFSADGQSSRLADSFVAKWRAANPGAEIIVRDLAHNPVPHLDAQRFGAFIACNLLALKRSNSYTPRGSRTERGRRCDRSTRRAGPLADCRMMT